MDAHYVYAQGRLTQLDYGDYHYAFSYDIWGNVLSVTMNDALLVTYDYGSGASKGMVETMTYGNGQQVFYTYNTLGQVIAVGYTGQPVRFSYTYDSTGNLYSIFDAETEQTTEYTESGYEIRSEDGTVLYSYANGETNDYAETINGVTYQSVLQNQNNSSSGGKEIKDASGNLILSANISYDAFNRLRRKSVNAAGVETTRDYDYHTDENGNTGSLVEDYYAKYSVPGYQTVLSSHYTYDGNGNITGITTTESTSCVGSITDPQPSGSTSTMSLPSETNNSVSQTQKTYTTTYAYDEAGQLTEVVDGENGTIYRYTYDSMGNILTAEQSAAPTADIQYHTMETTYQYTNGVLSGYTGPYGESVTYETDAMGNPTKITEQLHGGTIGRLLGATVTTTLTWGEGRMLTGIRRDAQNQTTYTYNADGLRTEKAVTKNGTTAVTRYIWGDNGLAAAITGDQTVVLLYDSEGEAVGFSVDGTVYTYVKNLQGDVLRVLDADGAAVVSYSYNPWGVPTVSGDSDLAAINPCSYRSYYYDQETGYYYLQSRYYDPIIGHFLNTDETELLCTDQGSITQYNLFLYCQNNAISNSDPTGYGTLTIVLKVSFLRRWLGKGCGLIAKAIALYIFKGIKWAGTIGFVLGWIIGRALGSWLIKKDICFSVYIPFVSARTWTLY